MATKYLTLTGLGYFYNRLKTIFVAQETGKGLSTNDYTDAEKAEVAKIAGLVATGGEPNVIETVKFGNTVLTPNANKQVRFGIGMSGGAVEPDEYGVAWIPAPTMRWGGDTEPYQWSLSNLSDRVQFDNHANGIQIDLEREHSDSPQTVSYSKVLPDEARVNALIAAAQVGVIWDIVTDLPTTGTPGKMYLKGPGGSGQNIYEEWIWVNSGTAETPNWHWENIGTTAIDLSGYLQTTDIEAITTAEIDEIVAATTP